jgi:hypothetical protein
LIQKIFFKDEIEIFKGVSTPKIVENPPKVILQLNITQAHASPHVLRNPVNSRRHPEQSHNVINLWFLLFSEILGDDRLIEKFQNTLYLFLGDEGNPETIVTTNLPKKNTHRIQRRKVRIGK